MAKIQGRNARILFGNRNLSCDTNQATFNLTADAPEVTAFCDNYRARLQDGIKDAELSLDGFMNTGASEMDSFLSVTLAGSALTGVYHNGLAGSKIGREYVGILTQYQMTNAFADAAGVSLTISSACGTIYHTQSLSGSTIDTRGLPVVIGASTFTQNSIDLKGAADTLGSSYITLRLLELTGTDPAFSASVQYSANDSAFTTVYMANSLSPASVAYNSASLTALASASRYARVIVALAGTSPCAIYQVACGSTHAT